MQASAELAALLGDLEQLYQGHVSEVKSPKPTGHVAPGLPPRPKVNPYAHLQPQQYVQAEPSPPPQQQQYVQARVGPAATLAAVPPAPVAVPSWQHQAELERKQREEEEKELIIRRQQQMIEEQTRQIALLQQQQKMQLQQPPAQLHQPAPAGKGPLDDVLEDLQQLIESEARALPDAILSDIEKLGVDDSTAIGGRHQIGSPAMINYAPATSSAPRGQGAAGTYAFRSGSAIVPGSGSALSRSAAPANAGGAYAFLRSGSAIKSNPAATSSYASSAGTVSAAASPALTVRGGVSIPNVAMGPRSGSTIAMSSPRSYSVGSRTSAQEVHQRIAAGQAENGQRTPALTMQRLQSFPAGTQIGSPKVAHAFSARKPQVSSTKRPALPALYSFVREGQFDVPPAKLPLVPREVREGEPSAVTLTMGLVDGSTKKMVVTEDFTVQDVLILYASKLGLWQVDFFQLAEARPGKADRWLHPAIKVGQYGFTEASKLIMKIKYFKRPKFLVDSIALRLFYLQIQANVVAGAYPCAERLAIRLAAQQLQIQEGDHQPQRHKPGWFGGTEQLQKYVPPEILFKSSVDYIEERIFRLHAKMVGKNNQDALIKEYIDLAASIPTFGMNLYNVFDGEYDKGGVKRRLGVGEDGIMLTRRGEKNIYDFYPWTKMGGWLKASDTLFNVKVVGQPIFTFQAPAECVFDILELLTGYYLIAFHSDPSVPEFPVPYEPDCLPHPRLFLPVKPRNIQNVYIKSCLEVFKETYEAGCKEYMVVPVDNLQLQIDETLDHGGVLKKLDLRKCDFNEFQFKSLLKALEATSTHTVQATNDILITEIDLSGNQSAITSRSALAIVQLIAACPKLRILNLNDNSLGYAGSIEVAAALSTNLTLHELHVASNHTMDKGMAALVKALKGSQALHTFDFTNNGLTADACKLLGEMLEKNPHVTTLCLARNNFGDVGINHLYYGIKANSTLQRINLAQTGFSAKAGKHLMRVITEKPNLVSVKLAYNDIGPKGGMMLGAYLTVGSRLSVIDLTSTNIGPKALKSIGKGLKENKSVTALKLSNNEFDKKSSQALVEALIVNRTLQILAIAQCSFPKSSFLSLMHALQHRNTTLRRLNVSNNPTNAEVAQAIGNMMANNATLQVFNLAGCLSSDGVKEITVGIGANRALVKLNLSGCKMNKAVWTSLADTVLQNRTLERLVCKETACDTRLLEEILNHWDMRKHMLHIKVLNMSNNPIQVRSVEERIRHYPMRIVLS